MELPFIYIMVLLNYHGPPFWNIFKRQHVFTVMYLKVQFWLNSASSFSYPPPISLDQCDCCWETRAILNSASIKIISIVINSLKISLKVLQETKCRLCSKEFKQICFSNNCFLCAGRVKKEEIRQGKHMTWGLGWGISAGV